MSIAQRQMVDFATSANHILGYIEDHMLEVAKDVRKWASPQAHKALAAAIEQDKAFAVDTLIKLEKLERVEKVGGLRVILGPRSNAAKLVAEALAS